LAIAAAETFRRAALLNIDDARRKGSTVHLPAESLDIIVAGDIHGDRSALSRIIDYSSLGPGTGRVLVLQEIIHGPLDPRSGHDRSVELLLRAARLKEIHPEQVLFVLGNHELAQVTGNEISKDGRGVCRSFVDGVDYCFGDQAEEVMEAVKDFAMSMPLAIRCGDRVLVSHSLPDAARMSLAGVEILDRRYGPDDLNRGKSVYEWTWGRSQTDEQTDALAEELDVEFFLVGHKHVENGWEMLTTRAAAIASNGPNGCVVEFTSNEGLDGNSIADHVRPVATLKPQ